MDTPQHLVNISNHVHRYVLIQLALIKQVRPYFHVTLYQMRIRNRSSSDGPSEFFNGIWLGFIFNYTLPHGRSIICVNEKYRRRERQLADDL